VFEHLDDARPPAFGAGFRRAVVGRARRRRRRRLAGGAGVAAAALVAGAGGLYGRALWRLDRLERVDVAGTGQVPAGEPVTVLIVGTDGQAGVDGVRTDTVLVARLDPQQSTAGLLSLPRDLLVDDPAGGADPVMLGHVATVGGLAALVGVVEDQVGIPVDHVVEVSMDGLRGLVDAAGGVEVHVDAALRDERSGLYIDQPGCVTLDGEQALALLRSRALEVRGPSGAWERDPLADLSRVDRQRAVAIAALAGAADDWDPVSADRLAGLVADHVTVDADLDLGEMADLARAVLGLEADAVSQATLPVVPHPADENRLALDPARAPAVVAAFVRGQSFPAAPPPGVPPWPLAESALVSPCRP
jgi:polyisoprenyl-teichoic acid--peptidoglycan teichoic acid transferase